MRELLGNIEDLKDYHKNIFLPKLESACNNSSKMRLVVQKTRKLLKAVCRNLFECEKNKLGMKYGRYCINTCRSNNIIQQNLIIFSNFQSVKGLKLRLDAVLIKPVQRITRCVQCWYFFFYCFIERRSLLFENQRQFFLNVKILFN